VAKTNQKPYKGLAAEDYYFSPEGYIVFTEKYHLKRGYCCNSGCKHCPFKQKSNIS
jgi:2-iminoacetate synthase ThiH